MTTLMTALLEPEVQVVLAVQEQPQELVGLVSQTEPETPGHLFRPA
jgi:hypothetical protein